MRTSRMALVVMALAMACSGGGDPAGPYTPPGGNGGTTGSTGTTGTTGTTGSTGGTGSGSTTNQIVVNDGGFTPSSTTVTPGTTVTWSWEGTTEHNVTFNDTSIGASPDQINGSFSRVFGNTGSFGYRCTRHAGMEGTINVAAQ